jgi:RibD C-terminal domain
LGSPRPSIETDESSRRRLPGLSSAHGKTEIHFWHVGLFPEYESLDWPGSHIVDGDMLESVGKLKAEGEARIAVLGSGMLVHTLITSKSIDEYIVFMQPLVMGTGKRLFCETPSRCGCGWSIARRPPPALFFSPTRWPLQNPDDNGPMRTTRGMGVSGGQPKGSTVASSLLALNLRPY